MRQRQATLRHHFHKVTVAEFETQVPPHTQDDDLPVKMAALEQLIHTQEPGHRITFSLSERPNMGRLKICTRAIIRTYWTSIARPMARPPDCVRAGVRSVSRAGPPSTGPVAANHN